MIKFIKKILRHIFCSHDSYRFVRNIGGDEMMHYYVKGGGLAKSEHVCIECNTLIHKPYRVNEK